MSNKLSLDFNRYKPKQTYTFEVEFSSPKPNGDGKSYKRLTTAVQQVTLVKIPIQIISDEQMGFGLYWNIIPIHDIDSKEMKITFDETDDMLVSSVFGSMINYSNQYKDLWDVEQTDIIITIKYFNEYKYDDKNKQSAEKIERYRAIVKEITHPNWSRAGNVDRVEVVVTFKVMLDDYTVQDANGNDVVVQVGERTNYEYLINKRYQALAELFSESGKPVVPYTPLEKVSSQSTRTPERVSPVPPMTPEKGSGGDNTPNPGSGRSSRNYEVRYRKKKLTELLASGRLKDADGNTITSEQQLRDITKNKKDKAVYVNGHKYKIVIYGSNISLNSNVSGNNFFYKKQYATPEEAFQNITSEGKIPYNLGGKADGDISDGIDCMGFAGILLSSIGATVVDKDGNPVKNKNGNAMSTDSIFKNYSCASFLKNGLKVKGPDGVDVKVYVKANSSGTGHIVIEYDGKIYESKSSSGVTQSDSSKFNYSGYKNVMK